MMILLEFIDLIVFWGLDNVARGYRVALRNGLPR